MKEYINVRLLLLYLTKIGLKLRSSLSLLLV